MLPSPGHRIGLHPTHEDTSLLPRRIRHVETMGPPFHRDGLCGRASPLRHEGRGGIQNRIGPTGRSNDVGRTTLPPLHDRGTREREEAEAKAMADDLFGGVDARTPSGGAGGAGQAMMSGDKVVMKDLKDHLRHAKKVGECIQVSLLMTDD